MLARNVMHVINTYYIRKMAYNNALARIALFFVCVLFQLTAQPRAGDAGG